MKKVCDVCGKTPPLDKDVQFILVHAGPDGAESRVVLTGNKKNMYMCWKCVGESLIEITKDWEYTDG